MTSYSSIIRDNRPVDLSGPPIIRDKRPVDLTIRDDLHFQTCPLHDHDSLTKCFGRLRKGGSCSNKAVGPLLLGTMPTCKVHRDQMKMMAWCRSPMRCGFECRRLYQWEPHGFQLCPEHNHLRPCYFLKIPTELRLRIYQYLLPDRDIQAQSPYNQYQPYNPFDLYGKNKLHLNILYVNRQIHDESIGVLYGTRFFNINFDGANLMMCNMPPTAPHGSQVYMGPGGNHALQDYQMQLMLLEQQNKKRVMMARQEQDTMNTSSSSNAGRGPPASFSGPSTVPVSSTGFTNSALNPISSNPTLASAPFMPGGPASGSVVMAPPPSPMHTFGPPPPPPPTYTSCFPYSQYPQAPRPAETAESIWVPPINHEHFNLIQSFRIQISFPFSMIPGSDVDEKTLESKLYETTDHLHRLVGRLCLTYKRIVQLEISIKFSNAHYITREKAFSCARILLHPFQRLRNVVNPGVSSITTIGVNNLDNELLPTWNAAAPEKAFADYVERWFRTMSHDEIAFVDPPVFDAYWQLKKLVLRIKQHCRDQPKLEEFNDLLHAARVVREEDNLPQFREIWDRVVNVWFDHLNEEKEFQSKIAMSIDGIYGTISDAEVGMEVEGKGKGRAW